MGRRAMYCVSALVLLACALAIAGVGGYRLYEVYDEKPNATVHFDDAMTTKIASSMACVHTGVVLAVAAALGAIAQGAQSAPLSIAHIILVRCCAQK